MEHLVASVYEHVVEYHFGHGIHTAWIAALLLAGFVAVTATTVGWLCLQLGELAAGRLRTSRNTQIEGSVVTVRLPNSDESETARLVTHPNGPTTPRSQTIRGLLMTPFNVVGRCCTFSCSRKLVVLVKLRGHGNSLHRVVVRPRTFASLDAAIRAKIDGIISVSSASKPLIWIVPKNELVRDDDDVAALPQDTKLLVEYKE